MKKSGWLFFGLIVSLVVSSLWSGFVFSVLWRWFVVPTLHVSPISIPVAIDLTLIVQLVTLIVQLVSAKGPSDDVDLSKSMWYSILYPLLALAVGFLAHLFV